MTEIIFILFGLILLSLLFFSRGILIFLTTLCLMFAQSNIEKIRLGPVYIIRWVFFALISFHVFGDIFLRRTPRKIKSFDIAAIIFIIYAFLSSFYSPYPTLTLERTATILFLYISVFWIIWKYAHDQGPEKVIYLILQVAMLVLIASYLAIVTTGSPYRPFRPFMFARFQGIFENPNALGIVCALLLPLALWKFLETKKKAALFLFFLMLISLFLSGSRNAINATVLAFGYFIYAYIGKYKPVVFFFSIVVILFSVWTIQTLAKDFFMVYYRVESIPTAAGRFEVWPIALNLIMNKPILGYGFGIEETLLKLQHIRFREHTGGAFHSSYLGITVQLGILGFIIFFGPLFILLFKEVFSKQDSQVPLLRYALRTSFIAGLGCAFFESWVYSVGNAFTFPFWIIIMLLVFYRYQDKEKPMPKEHLRDNGG